MGDQNQSPAPLDLSEFGGTAVQPAQAPAPAAVPPSATPSTAPLDLSEFGGKPASADTTAQPPQPSTMDKAMTAANKFVDQMPGIGDARALASVIHGWASQKAKDLEVKQLQESNKTGQGPSSFSLAPTEQFAARALSDVAGMAHGATDASNLAVGAGAVVAPWLVGPGLVAHGLHNVVTGWGDMVTPDAPGQHTPWVNRLDPDAVQNVLSAGAEAAGGGALTGEGAIKIGRGASAIKTRLADAGVAKAPAAAMKDFMDAVPPSKAAPYNEADYVAARPYLEQQHALDTIGSPEEVEKAANKALDEKEEKISRMIDANPDVIIKTNPLQAVQEALRDDPDTTFLQKGLQSLERFGLGFQRSGGLVDPPLTLRAADDLRWKLNQEMKGVLKKNNYDVATARAIDPGFAAAQAVTEALRDGVYNGLKDLGFDGIAQDRLDEGSLIKIRNAANRQMFKGEKPVAGTGNTGAVRNAAGKMIKIGATAEGAKLGGVHGAVIGQQVGEIAGNAVSGKNPLTRNQLLERSFSKTIHPQSGASAAASSATAAAAPASSVPATPVEPKPIYAYRSRDVGDIGIPSKSNAQATMSEAEARGHASGRGAITGKNQEIVRVNLNDVGHTKKTGPNGNDWVKFNSDVPESAVEKVPTTSIAPSATRPAAAPAAVASAASPTATKNQEAAPVASAPAIQTAAKADTREPVDTNSLLDKAAQDYDLDPKILHAQARQESGPDLNNEAVSSKGAKGVMQLMPRTAKSLGVDVKDPAQNVDGGARLMGQLHKRFGRYDRALAAYDWSPDKVQDAIDTYGDKWLEHTPEETQKYVHKILRNAAQ